MNRTAMPRAKCCRFDSVAFCVHVARTAARSAFFIRSTTRSTDVPLRFFRCASATACTQPSQAHASAVCASRPTARESTTRCRRTSPTTSNHRLKARPSPVFAISRTALFKTAC